jgi:hypothetical protein
MKLCELYGSIIFGLIFSYIIKINYQKKIHIIECMEKFTNNCNEFCFK